jgi:hypothetical protein
MRSHRVLGHHIATYDAMKHSKRQRKFLNSMRQMGDVPWPERRFKYPPTFGRVSGRHLTLAARCERAVGETRVKTSRFRRKQVAPVLCGGKLIAKLGRTGGRRVYCESCRARRKQQRLERRMELQLKSRFGIEPRVAEREERRTTRMLARFRRSGVR